MSLCICNYPSINFMSLRIDLNDSKDFTVNENEYLTLILDVNQRIHKVRDMFISGKLTIISETACHLYARDVTITDTGSIGLVNVTLAAQKMNDTKNIITIYN